MTPVFAMDVEGMNIFRAVINGDRARVAQLLDQGALIDSQDDYECTPLILAVDIGDTDMVRLLLDRGASPTKYGPFRMKPIDVVNANDNREIRQLLIDASVARREAHNVQPQERMSVLQPTRSLRYKPLRYKPY